MSVIDEIQDRLDIVDEIGGVVKLRRSGRNWVGLCPFHTEKTPSFVVFPHTQRWFCFGQCHTGGDVIDFWVKREGWELKEAVRTLAQKAGVTLRPQSQEEQRRQELRREREDVLGAAMAFFQRSMRLPDMLPVRDEELSGGLRYALLRGWTLETMREVGLGYFDGDWNGLRAHLTAAGVDVEAPAAVALVGLRGDVAEWAKRRGVDAPGVWIEKGKVPAMPPNLLVYPHLVRGRVVYLSGRLADPEGKFHWNLDAALVGEKQPFFNQVWGRGGGQATGKKRESAFGGVVIVEGQADAISLGQWGFAAAALAGASLGGGEG